MNGDADISIVAGLIAEGNRAEMLLALLGGTPSSGSALAESARISRSLASAHLRKLVDGGLVTVERRGRQRLYSLAGADVAEALEGLIAIAPPSPVRSLRQATRSEGLRRARLCYDHLAGTLGVAITDAMIARDLIRRHDGGFELGSEAAAGFAEIGVDLAALEDRRRPTLRACLDWTERRDHLAGGLGAAIAQELIGRGWIRTREATRIVTLTARGARGLRDWIGVELAEARESANSVRAPA
jgi:DNA-binding transcriptional ArsR family regulator